MTIKEQWQSYHDEALVFTSGSFEYTVSDIRDDFYSGATAALVILVEAMGGGPQAALDAATELQKELEDYDAN